MSKEIIIKYTIDDEFDEADALVTLKAASLARALYEIHQQLFRPHYKHGYSDPDFNKMVDELAEDANEDTIIDHLSKMYWEILDEYGIDLTELGY